MLHKKPYIGQKVTINVTYEHAPYNRRTGKVVYINEKNRWFGIKTKAGFLICEKFCTDRYREFAEEIENPHAAPRKL